jgi:hypothetical protein
VPVNKETTEPKAPNDTKANDAPKEATTESPMETNEPLQPAAAEATPVLGVAQESVAPPATTTPEIEVFDVSKCTCALFYAVITEWPVAVRREDQRGRSNGTTAASVTVSNGRAERANRTSGRTERHQW